MKTVSSDFIAARNARVRPKPVLKLTIDGTDYSDQIADRTSLVAEWKMLKQLSISAVNDLNVTLRDSNWTLQSYLESNERPRLQLKIGLSGASDEFDLFDGEIHAGEWERKGDYLTVYASGWFRQFEEESVRDKVYPSLDSNQALIKSVTNFVDDIYTTYPELTSLERDASYRAAGGFVFSLQDAMPANKLPSQIAPFHTEAFQSDRPSTYLYGSDADYIYWAYTYRHVIVFCKTSRTSGNDYETTIEQVLSISFAVSYAAYTYPWYTRLIGYDATNSRLFFVVVGKFYDSVNGEWYNGVPLKVGYVNTSTWATTTYAADKTKIGAESEDWHHYLDWAGGTVAVAPWDNHGGTLTFYCFGLNYDKNPDGTWDTELHLFKLRAGSSAWEADFYTHMYVNTGYPVRPVEDTDQSFNAWGMFDSATPELVILMSYWRRNFKAGYPSTYNLRIDIQLVAGNETYNHATTTFFVGLYSRGIWDTAIGNQGQVIDAWGLKVYDIQNATEYDCVAGMEGDFAPPGYVRFSGYAENPTYVGSEYRDKFVGINLARNYNLRDWVLAVIGWDAGNSQFDLVSGESLATPEIPRFVEPYEMEVSAPVLVSTAINGRVGYALGFNVQKGVTQDKEQGNEWDSPNWQASSAGVCLYGLRWPWAIVSRDNWDASVKDFVDELAFIAGAYTERPLKEEWRFLDATVPATAVANRVTKDEYEVLPRYKYHTVYKGVILQAIGGEVRVGYTGELSAFQRTLRFCGKTQAGQVAEWWNTQFAQLSQLTKTVELKADHLYEYELRDRIEFYAPPDDESGDPSSGVLMRRYWKYPSTVILELAYAWIEGTPSEWQGPDELDVYPPPAWSDVDFNVQRWPSTNGYVNQGYASWTHDQGSPIVRLEVYVATDSDISNWEHVDTVTVRHPSSDYGRTTFLMPYLGPDHLVGLRGVDSSGRRTELIGPFGPFDSPPVESSGGVLPMSIDVRREVRSTKTVYDTFVRVLTRKPAGVKYLCWACEYKANGGASASLQMTVNGTLSSAERTGLTASTWTVIDSGTAYRVDISSIDDGDVVTVELKGKVDTQSVDVRSLLLWAE